MNDTEQLTVAMTEAQWDLVVLALGYVQERAVQPSATSGVGVIDVFARRVLRRRLNECITEIQSNVPSAGSGELDP